MWTERRDSSLRSPSGCRCNLFKSNKWVSLLFQLNIFTWPIWKACNTLWSAGCLIYNAFQIWVSKRQANITLKFHSAGKQVKMRVNVEIQRRKTQQLVCEEDPPGRIIRMCPEQNLNRSFPSVPHSPGTQLPLLAMFPQSMKKINRPTTITRTSYFRVHLVLFRSGGRNLLDCECTTFSRKS